MGSKLADTIFPCPKSPACISTRGANLRKKRSPATADCTAVSINNSGAKASAFKSTSFKTDSTLIADTELKIGGGTRIELIMCRGGRNARCDVIHLPDEGVRFVVMSSCLISAAPVVRRATFRGLLECDRYRSTKGIRNYTLLPRAAHAEFRLRLVLAGPVKLDMIWLPSKVLTERAGR